MLWILHVYGNISINTLWYSNILLVYHRNDVTVELSKLLCIKKSFKIIRPTQFSTKVSAFLLWYSVKCLCNYRIILFITINNVELEVNSVTRRNKNPGKMLFPDAYFVCAIYDVLQALTLA